MVSRLPPNMTHAWQYMGSPTENPMGVEIFGMVAGLGLRALVRLLVYELSGGPARDGRRFHVRRPPHSADRHPAQDVSAVHRDSARYRRAGAFEDEPRLRLPPESHAAAPTTIRP